MRIYSSDNNKDVYDKILKEVAQKSVDMSSNFLLVVPEKLSLTTERDILSVGDKKALTNVQVITLSRLLRKFVKSSDNYLPKESGVMIIKKIIIDNLDKLVCFNKTARTMGFAQRVYDTISNLKNSGVNPSDFSSKMVGVPESLKIKMQDILLLYSEYENYISAKGLVDASDRFILLSKMVDNSQLVKDSDVYIFGYDNISLSGLQVLKSIAKNAKSCCFGVTNNRGKNNSYIIEPEMYDNAVSIAEELGIVPTIVEIKSSANSISSHIRNNLFAYPYEKMQIGNEISLIECKSASEEIEFVAEVIRKNIIKKEMRYNEFCIACPNLEGYGEVIKSVFEEYQIPYFLDASQKLSSHPLILFINSIIDCYKKHFSSEEVVSLIKNFFCGIDISIQDEFENYIIKYGINYDKFKKPFEFGKEDRSGEITNSYKIVETARISLVNKLFKVFSAISEAKTTKQFSSAVRSIFEIFELDEKIDSFIEQLEIRKDRVMIDFTKQVKQKLFGIIDEVDKNLGDTQLPFDEYVAIIQSGIQSESVSLIPVSLDSVFIGDVSLSKFSSTKYMFVIGAGEGAVPKIVEDCGIIVDKEVALLQESIGKKIEPTIKTINKRERYKFIELLQAFTERLYVMYPKTDLSLSEQKPSIALQDLAKIFYKEKHEQLEVMTIDSYRRKRSLLPNEDREKNYAYEFATEKVAYKKLLGFVRATESNVMSDNRPAIDALYAHINNTGKIKSNEIIENIPKEVKITNAKSLYFYEGETSISQLECYFNCPFKFFANYGLRLKEREESLLKSVDFGNVLHRIAELYIKNIENYLKIKPHTALIKKLDALIDRVFEEEKIKVASNKHIILPLKNEARRLIDALTEQYMLSNFKPVAEEFSFGAKGQIKGLDLGSGIKLKGKIDRIDSLGKMYRVIDYKTGKTDLQAKNVYYGNKIQLFMYLNAMNSSKKTPVGAFYLPIKSIFIDEELGTFLATYKLQGYFIDDIDVARNMDNTLSAENTTSTAIQASIKLDKTSEESDKFVLKKQNHILSKEQLLGVMDYTKEISKIAVSEILAGSIKKSPIKLTEKPVCEFCPYKNICGEVPSENMRKTKSVAFEDFAIVKNEKEGVKNEK